METSPVDPILSAPDSLGNGKIYLDSLDFLVTPQM